MRAPDIAIDGWCLDDAEARQAANPGRFEIPPPFVREGLWVGDFAQLIFRIAVDDDEDPEEFERMWVIVREVRDDGGYIGILDNEPGSIEENEDFWRGVDLPFEPRHVIDAKEGNDESARIAAAPPKRPWS